MKSKKNRSKTFEFFKRFLRIFKRKPKFVFLGEEFQENSIYLCNHAGASSPLTLELYFPLEMRFWGTHEMNEGFKERYKYLSNVYFHQKRHLPLWFSKFISIFATPFMGMFYKGIRLISTYTDGRLVTTIKKSLKLLFETNESLIIFPEDSSHGYYDFLKGFHPGFYALSKKALKDGKDLSIYLMYYQRINKRIIVDKPIKFSKLQEVNSDMRDVAEKYRLRANVIASFTDKDIEEERQKEHFMLSAD